MLHFREPLSLAPHLSPPYPSYPICLLDSLAHPASSRQGFSPISIRAPERGPAHEQLTQHGPNERMQSVVVKRGCHGKGVKDVKFPVSQGYIEWCVCYVCVCGGGITFKSFWISDNRLYICGCLKYPSLLGGVSFFQMRFIILKKIKAWW